VRRQEEEGTGLLLPVLLDNCALPEIISERRYYDLSDPLKEPEVVQTLLNQILGIKPFSQRIRDFLNEPDGTSPYDQNARRRGRLLLQEAARFRDLKISRNQKWLPWELFHNLLNRYTCTLRLGRSFGAADDCELSANVRDLRR
jgi:hypothetical protein